MTAAGVLGTPVRVPACRAARTRWPGCEKLTELGKGGPQCHSIASHLTPLPPPATRFSRGKIALHGRCRDRPRLALARAHGCRGERRSVSSLVEYPSCARL